MLPALELVDTLEELRAAAEDVEGFLLELSKAASGAAIRMAIARLRPQLEMLVAKLHLTWEDVLPVLVHIDSIEELQAAFDDAEGFLMLIICSSRSRWAIHHAG